MTFKDRMLLYADDDVKITGSTTVRGVTLTRELEALTFFNSGRDVDRKLSGLFFAATLAHKANHFFCT
ncbi:hypothetical protein D3C87_2066000 [compost metagenome]